MAFYTRGFKNPVRPPPDLLVGLPYSRQFGSIAAEIINLTSWEHTLFRLDQALVYDYMAQALKGSDAESVLCGAVWTQKLGSKVHSQAVEQYAGDDKKWASIRDDKLEKMTSTKYKGTGKYSLSKHATFHKKLMPVYKTVLIM